MARLHNRLDGVRIESDPRQPLECITRVYASGNKLVFVSLPSADGKLPASRSALRKAVGKRDLELASKEATPILHQLAEPGEITPFLERPEGHSHDWHYYFSSRLVQENPLVRFYNLQRHTESVFGELFPRPNVSVSIGYGDAYHLLRAMYPSNVHTLHEEPEGKG